MFRLALLFLVIALVAGFFGFPLIATFSYEGARLLFFVFVVLAILFLLGDLARGPQPRPTR